MASLFDSFNSGPGKKAAKKGYNYTTQGLNQGFNEAKGYVTGGTKTGRNDIGGGTDNALDYLGDSYGDARDELGRGADEAQGFYSAALPTWENLVSQGNKGYGAYSDAAGANGAEGYDRATTNFRTNPGYEFQRDQGLDAINRTANSRGMLASGNNTHDLLKFSQGLADQSYQGYVGNLLPFLNQSNVAAAGKTGLYSQMADLSANEGINKANLATGYGVNRSNIATGQGSELANLAAKQGYTMGDLANQRGIGLGQAGSQMVQDQYAAEQGANQNMWNAILGLGGMATKGMAFGGPAAAGGGTGLAFGNGSVGPYG